MKYELKYTLSRLTYTPGGSYNTIDPVPVPTEEYNTLKEALDAARELKVLYPHTDKEHESYLSGYKIFEISREIDSEEIDVILNTLAISTIEEGDILHLRCGGQITADYVEDGVYGLYDITFDGNGQLSNMQKNGRLGDYGAEHPFDVIKITRE